MTEALFIGLDLGGTEVKIGVGRASGELLWHGRRKSRGREGGAAILEALGAATTTAVAEAESRGGKVMALGLGTPGVVDHTTGKIRYPVANLGGWHGTDLPAFFREKFGLPAVVENDANAAAWGEFRRGAGRGCHSLVMATIGTGVGGGAVIEGQLVRGANGGAMELGHSLFVAGGRECHCGLSGCIEAYAGGRSMTDEWLRQAEARGQSLTSGGSAEPALSELLNAATSGNPVASEVLDEGARALGRGLVSVIHLINPEVLILGGGILDARPQHRKLVIEALQDSLLPKARERLKVTSAERKNSAGMIGALCLAADSVASGEKEIRGE